jgi:hypothetical protein
MDVLEVLAVEDEGRGSEFTSGAPFNNSLFLAKRGIF